MHGSRAPATTPRTGSAPAPRGDGENSTRPTPAPSHRKASGSIRSLPASANSSHVSLFSPEHPARYPPLSTNPPPHARPPTPNSRTDRNALTQPQRIDPVRKSFEAVG